MTDNNSNELYCSGHGEASFNDGGNATCICDYYFNGADCSIPLSQAVGYGGWAAFMAALSLLTLYGFIATVIAFRRRFYCWNVCLCGDGYTPQQRRRQRFGKKKALQRCSGCRRYGCCCCNGSSCCCQRRQQQKVKPLSDLKGKTLPHAAAATSIAIPGPLPSTTMTSTPAGDSTMMAFPPQPPTPAATGRSDGRSKPEETAEANRSARKGQRPWPASFAAAMEEPQESKYAGEFGPRISNAAQRRPLRAWKDLNIRDLAAYLNFIGTGLRLIWCIGELQPLQLSLPSFLY